jgi:hypothetical protein
LLGPGEVFSADEKVGCNDFNNMMRLTGMRMPNIFSSVLTENKFHTMGQFLLMGPLTILITIIIGPTFFYWSVGPSISNPLQRNSHN